MHNSMPNLPLLDEEVDIPLPQPLFEGNAVTYTTQCVMDTSLASHLLNSSVSLLSPSLTLMHFRLFWSWLCQKSLLG